MTNLDRVLKSKKHYSAIKGPYSQGYGLPSVHVRLWELDHKEGRAPKNWCLQIWWLEKTPQSPLDSKEIKPVNLKGNQPWILIGRTDAPVWEAPVFWSSDVNSDSLEKTQMLGNTEGRRRRGCQRMRWLEGITDAMNMNWGKLWEMVRTERSGVLQLQRVRHYWVTDKHHFSKQILNKANHLTPHNDSRLHIINYSKGLRAKMLRLMSPKKGSWDSVSILQFRNSAWISSL